MQDCSQRIVIRREVKSKSKLKNGEMEASFLAACVCASLISTERLAETFEQPATDRRGRRTMPKPEVYSIKWTDGTFSGDKLLENVSTISPSVKGVNLDITRSPLWSSGYPRMLL